MKKSVTAMAVGMAAGVLALAQPALARLAVYTGAPAATCTKACQPLDATHWLTGQFTVGTTEDLEMVYGFIGGTSGKTFTMALLSDAAGTPGSVLYSTQVKYNSRVGWQGLNNLFWKVPKGSYWIAYEVTPTDNLVGYMPAPAPHPLKFSDIGVAGAWTPANGIGFGVRIYHQPDGTPAGVSHAAAVEQIPATAVPEPAAWTLMLGGVCAMGGALRARRRRAPRPA